MSSFVAASLRNAFHEATTFVSRALACIVVRSIPRGIDALDYVFLWWLLGATDTLVLESWQGSLCFTWMGFHALLSPEPLVPLLSHALLDGCWWVLPVLFLKVSFKN